ALNDKSVWCVMQDRSGQVWTGTWRGGVNVLDERLDRFELIRFDSKDTNSLPAATVWSMCSDGGKGLWLGTAAGPAHYDPLTKTFWRPHMHPYDPEGPPSNADIQTLCKDGNGNIWMGTAGNGIYRYDTAQKKFTHYPKNHADPHAIGDEIINCVNVDHSGRVWVGAGHAALQLFDPSINGFISFPLEEKDSLTFGVYSIANAGDDELLIGFLTGDVMRFNMKTKTFTRIWKNTTAISISALYQDKFGGVWIGTNGSGLIYVKNSSVTYFTEKDSLPNNVINGIVPGTHDELWLSCDRGLCRFDPISKSVRSFTPEDGLQGYEFNQSSNARTPDGKLWFGGVKGFNGFFPKDILPNLTPAPAVITAFTVLNRSYPLDSDILYTKDISLTYRDYFFSFDFAGLEFTNPKRNHYKYMMEGFDAEWVDAGDRRFVTYTNLDPGEYTFHVMASNNDGYWGGKEAVIHITISPPFWRTKWFYTLCGLTLILSIWLFIRRRERILRKEKEILETKVSERTFELQQEKEKVTAAHKDIKDSINYAQRIQYALLAHEELLKQQLKDYCIFFQPKDVVSGDFYWATRRTEPGGRNSEKESFYLAVCDSTGHGVPGAFMSLLNISFLNEAINEKQITEPSKVFDHVRERLIRNISQEGAKDGMDAILAEFVAGSDEIRYAAAHNAPLIIRGNEVLQQGADKMPVGKGEKEENFTLRTMKVQKGDVVYFYTDGFSDQFGGAQGKKFKEANLRKFLLDIAQLPMKEQQEKLKHQFEEWKGELEQVDDVLILGVRII
ncbi:MAG TPA: SpoIIE family protein phosphatase, partial [Bacteroidia bacterium]|nr:SpoIIE family protein phosphatase [Bacteroidia bacterium]